MVIIHLCLNTYYPSYGGAALNGDLARGNRHRVLLSNGTILKAQPFRYVHGGGVVWNATVRDGAKPESEKESEIFGREQGRAQGQATFPTL